MVVSAVLIIAAWIAPQPRIIELDGTKRPLTCQQIKLLSPNHSVPQVESRYYTERCLQSKLL